MNLICRIQFDSPEVEAGGLLSGILRLLEDTPSVTQANLLRLRATCKVEGPGAPESRVLTTAELEGPFRVQANIPFRIAIPKQGPISYQGIILRLSWHLGVELLVPGGMSSRYETSFQVVPARSRVPTPG